MHSWVIALLATGCFSKWEAIDADGDGLSVVDGDCWDYSTDPVPPEGALDHGVTASDIYPGAEDLPYDGIDANCDGLDDFDQDQDGFVPTAYVGIATLGLENSGVLPSGDCYDEPVAQPIDGRLGDAVFSGVEVYPGAEDVPYDGIDANCDGLDDFDQDQDGFVPTAYEGFSTVFSGNSEMLPSGDCWDSLDVDFVDPTGDYQPSEVHPNANEVYYDGVDANCDARSDCDQDEDGFDVLTGHCVEVVSEGERIDCNDLDATVFPNDNPEIYFNGIDDNCDSLDGDGDRDGDGYWSVDYPFTAGEVDTSVTLPEALNDCWDDPSSVSEAYTVLNGFSALDASDVHPSATDRWYDGVAQDCLDNSDFDQDGDGFASSYFADRSGSFGDDCVDAVSDPDYVDVGLLPEDIYPGNGTETYYDGVDQNCDFLSDYDQDEDGQDAEGFGGDDCNDLNPDIYLDPNLTEGINDGVDQNCDLKEACYLDVDQDGYGNASGTIGLSTDLTCTGEVGFANNVLDCDDGDATISPIAVELCDGQVNTCGGGLPSDEVDDDGDGFVECVIDANGWDDLANIKQGEDCDDTDSTLNPNTVWFADTDVDGFGDAGNTQIQCQQPSGHIADNTDCNDDDATISPIAVEVCDGQVNTCGGTLPSDEVDDDGDGFVECALDSNGWDDLTNVKQGEDCDDGDATISPTASELCDGQVNTCGGTLPSDEVDDDGDGFVECTIDSNGWDDLTNVKQGDDCDDGDATLNPNTVWFADTDVDGFGDAGNTQTQCQQPTGHIADNTDCNDGESTVFPNAPELCDGQVNTCGAAFSPDEIDNDGDGFVECAVDSGGWDGTGQKLGEDCDDGDASLNPNTMWFADSDVDGFGDAGDTLTQCLQPSGYIADNTDCDDADAVISPNTVWYADADVDGFGDAGNIQTQCLQPSGYLLDNNDCDDTDVAINPDTVWYVDADVDGFGDAGNALTQCLQPSGYIADNTDCDDTDGVINPDTVWYVDADVDGFGDAGNSQIQCIQPSGHVLDDSDCDDTDGVINPETVWYADVDVDGFGDAGNTLAQCIQPSGYIDDDSDCDDGDATSYPGAFDVFDDGIDQNCDGVDATGLTGSELQVGDLIITEMMVDTHVGGADEWFEVYNTTSETIDLFGLYIEDNNLNNRRQIPDHVEIPPNSYFVFVSNDDPQSNGGFDWSNIPHYDYPSIGFNNDGDDIALVYDNGSSQLVLFEIVYTDSGATDFHYERGVSAIVDDESIVSNNDSDLWCSSRTLYHTNSTDDTEYYGTPGSSNDVCDDDGDTHFYYADGSGDCDDGDATVFPGATETSDDGVDQDCDGFERCIVDGDGDGFGNAAGTLGNSSVLTCDGSGFSQNSDDCDDTDLDTYPWAPETADNTDNNCDGLESLNNPIETCVGNAYFDSTLGFDTYLLACDTSMTWADALSVCENVGYDGLAKIRTNFLNFELEGIMDENFWLGLNDRSTETVYEWSDGTLWNAQSDYENWKNGLNSNLNAGEDCVRMNKGGQWEDKSCSDTNRIACSIELP